MNSRHDVYKKLLASLDQASDTFNRLADEAKEEVSKVPAAAMKEMEDLLAEIEDDQREVNALTEEVRKLSEESKAIRGTVADALAPIKSYNDELSATYMKWRDAHEQALVDKLNRLQKLTESASSSGEWLRTRIREKKTSGDSETTVNVLINALRKARKGDLAKKLEGLRAEWNKVVESEHAASEQAKYKLRIHLQEQAEVMADAAKKAGKEADKASDAMKKQKEKGTIDEAARRLVEKMQASQKQKDAAAKAMAEAADKLGSKSKSSLTAELDGNADHAMDLFQTSGAATLEVLDNAIAMMEEFANSLQEAADEMPESEEAPAEEAPAEEAPAEVEQPAEQPAEEEAPAEQERELVPAGASLHTEATDAEVAEVEKLQGDITKILSKIEKNAQQRHVLKGMKAAINLKPREPYTSKEKAPKNKDPEDMTKDQKELRLHEIKEEQDKDRAAIKDLKSELEAKKDELIDKMEEHGVQELELKGKIEAKLVEIKDEEKKALEKARKQDIQNIQTNADSFQDWLAKSDKVTTEENAVLVRAIEALNGLSQKIDKQLSVEKQPRSVVPEEVVEETEKELAKHPKKKPAPATKKTSLNGEFLRTAGEIVDGLSESLEELTEVAKMAEDLEGYEECISDLDALEFEAEPAEGADAPAEDAPSEEEPGWLEQIMPPAPNMEMAPMPASLENPWLKEADMKEFPSEHDISSNKLDLVETVEAGPDGGKAELVIRKDVKKDLKARVETRLNEMHKGAYRPGQRVAVDLGGSITEGTIVKYAGNREYEVEVAGQTIKVPHTDLFSANADIWR